MNVCVRLFVVLLMCLSTLPVLPFNDKTRLNHMFFIIQDYSKADNLTSDILNGHLLSNIEQRSFGFKLHLRETPSGIFIVNKDRNICKADSTFIIISDFLGKEHVKKNFLPLFIDYDGTKEVFDALITKYGLESKLLSLNDNPPSSCVSQLDLEKRLLIFLRSDFSDYGKYADYNNYIVNGYTSAEDYDRFFLVENFIEELNDEINPSGEIKYSHSFQDRLLDIWRKNTLSPSFIFNKYLGSTFMELRPLAHAVNSTPHICGNIEKKDSLWVEEVYLKEDVSISLDSYFCLPLDKFHTLTPISEGVRFEPSRVDMADNQEEVSLKVSAYNLYDNLLAYYPFDEDFDDANGRLSPENIYLAKIIEHKKRGFVANFPSGAYIKLQDIDKYNLEDSDITVSVWINLSAEILTDNYSPILGGGNPKYRQGLQLAVRDSRVYFGFWHMDVHGTRTILTGKWYHVAVKYNKLLQTVTIFVNGEKDCELSNVKSFLGKGGPFWIGQSVTIHNFQGNMDDLAIWNRALSDSEIISIYNGKKINPFSDNSSKWWFMGGGILVLLVISIILRKRKHVNEDTVPDGIETDEAKTDISVNEGNTEKKVEPSAVYKNRLYLFGTPSVYSGDDDVTHKISPKMMELFVFLIINKCFGRDVLQLKEVTETLWSDMESNKANNNRRVIVSRLKNFLQEFTNVQLVTDSKNEIGLLTDETVYIDLMRYKDIVNVGVNADTIYELLDILSRGAFLMNLKSDWIDSYYADLYDETVYFLSEQIEKNAFEEKILLAISKRLIAIEQCNEEAMTFMVQYYHKKGKMSVAENVYSHFCENFHRIYNIYYKKTFDDIVTGK